MNLSIYACIKLTVLKQEWIGVISLSIFLFVYNNRVASLQKKVTY